MNERQHNLDRQIGRNYGIDLLRIVSMFMIVILHVLGAGGVIPNTKPLSINYESAWLLEIAAFCAVNCYALISGYVGIFSKHKYSNLAELWLRVLFYSIGITVVFMIISPGDVGKQRIISSFFPTFTNQYWYFTSYVILFIFVPLLNTVLNTLNRKQIQVFLVSVIIAFSVLSPFVSIFVDDIFFLNNGYSAWWLIILYVLGGYIRQFGLLKHVKTVVLFLFYLTSIILAWLSKIGIRLLTQYIFGEPRYEDMWISYISIFILASAVFLLLVFERLDICNKTAKVIGVISPLVFSVYLIHLHPLVFQKLIINQFSWMGEEPFYLAIPLVLGISFAILVVCCVIDCIRLFLFKIINLKGFLYRIEKKIREKLLL